MMMPKSECRPVIVGVGDVIDRPQTPVQGRHPLQLLDDAIRAADRDGGGHWLRRIDSIDIVHLMSWPYVDLPGQLKSALGLPSAVRAVHGPVGGESPLRFIQEAAQRIARGEIATAVICGAEALSTVMKAAAAQIELPWPPRDPSYRFIRPEDMSPPEALKYGLRSPVDMYPLYENATRAHWGQDFAAAQAESAAIWSQFSEVAADSPYAWLPKRYAAAAIAKFDGNNRPIAWPYSKLMIANNSVNQGGAVILTSYGAAKAAGLGDEQLVFVWDGCAASEPRSILARDHYWHSTAQDAVLTQTLARNRLDVDQLDCVELYSCFPCVPKMARRTLGLGVERGPFTVAGGLTFFGAPLNAYMVHATTAMVRKLRGRRGTGIGLLYGQGEFVTKHHALIVSSQAPPPDVATGDASVQAVADAARAPVPALRETYVGTGQVETYTVFFGRDGAAQRGVVVARNDADERFVARIPAADRAALARFTDGANSDAWEAIGSRGRASLAADGFVDWSIEN